MKDIIVESKAPIPSANNPGGKKTVAQKTTNSCHLTLKEIDGFT